MLERLQHYTEQYEGLIAADDAEFINSLEPAEPKAKAKRVFRSPQSSQADQSELIVKPVPTKKDDGGERTHVAQRAPLDIKKPEAAVSASRLPHKIEVPQQTQTGAISRSGVAEESSYAARSPESALFIEREEESIADILNSIPLEASESSIRRMDPVAPETHAADEAVVSALLSVVETGGEQINFNEIPLARLAILGRLPTNDIVLPSTKVSRRHAQIEEGEAGYVITDLGSANGVYVNNNRIKESPLQDGDVIGIGRYKLRFSLAEAL